MNKPSAADAAAAGTDAANLLPCLKERKWIGRENTVCRALWEREASAYMPWLAVGFDHPHTFEFIGNERVAAMNTTAGELERRALENLRKRPATWESLAIDVPSGGRLQMLVCSDDFFAAERILDADFMMQAQRKLKGPGLLVGIPRRGLLIATNVQQNEDMVSAFGAAVVGQYSRGETALISPMLFAMKDGEIVAIIEAIAEAVVPDGEPKGVPEDEQDPNNEPYVTALVARNAAGAEEVHLMAGGPDGTQLALAIESAFMSLLKTNAQRKEFSGHINIVVLGMTPMSARPAVDSVFEHLQGLCSEISRGEETRFRVSLTYQDPDTTFGAADEPATPARSARTAAHAETRGPFTWWTGLSGWVRIVLGLIVGMLILNRILGDWIASWTR